MPILKVEIQLCAQDRNLLKEGKYKISELVVAQNTTAKAVIAATKHLENIALCLRDLTAAQRGY